MIAVLIYAHKNKEQVQRLINALKNENVEFMFMLIKIFLLISLKLAY